MSIEIKTLIKTCMKQLKAFGLTEGTLKSYRTRAFYPVERYLEVKYIITLDSNVVEELNNYFYKQYSVGTISKKSLNWRLRGIGILYEVVSAGEFKWKVFSQKKKILLSQYYEATISRFLTTLSCSDKRMSIYESIIRRFILMLTEHKQTDFSAVNSQFVRRFIIDIFKYRPKSMDDVTTALKRFIMYLNEISSIDERCYAMLASPRSREHKVKPCIKQDDLSRILGQINKNSAEGKRDYAVLVLAMTTGLRVGDIASLKLTSIDWRHNNIVIIQGKTKQQLILPLHKAAGQAVANYILNARPKSISDNIFVRNCAPYTGLHDGVSVSCIFRKYLRLANLEHKNCDGRTMHGLRRMLGTRMVSEGVPITTISQVLGHKDFKSSKQYISLDVTGLKKCTLELDSIGGVLD